MSGTIRYSRLPGRKMGFIRCPSAWLADDHILLIDNMRFSETYQRVYLSDVQALATRRKPRFVMHWPYLLILPPILMAIFGNFPGWFKTAVLVGVVVFVIARTLLSLRFGCHLYLITAVGSVEVRAVASILTARRFAARITPAITAIQQPTV